MNYVKQNHLSLLIIAFLFVSAIFGGSASFGAANDVYVNYPMIVDSYAGGTGSITVNDSGSIKIGTSGTTLNEVNHGICYIRPYATTIAATSTATVDCQGTQAWNAAGTVNVSALTGIDNNDYVVANLSTTTAGTTNAGLQVIGAAASSTAGYITLRIANLTGGTYTWPITAGVASGTAYYYAGE